MAQISISGRRTVAEGASGDSTTLRFLVLLSEIASQDVTLQYDTADSTAKNAATAGLDYEPVVAGQFTIAAGQQSGFIDVQVLGDALKEGNEVFNLVLSNAVGAGFAKGSSLNVVGTIVDDEPTLSVKAAKLVEGAKGGLAKMQFVVSLSDVAGQDVTFKASTLDSTAKNAAKAGDDYVALAGLDFTIEKGKTSTIVEVEVINDAVRESDEVFNLKISDVVGAGLAKGTELITAGTIIDNEPTVSIAPAKVVEGAAAGAAKMQFVVSLSGVAEQDVTFTWLTLDGTAKAADGDYVSVVTAEGTIAAGQSSTILEVEVLNDTLKERDEIFSVVLFDVKGAGFAKGTKLTGVGTIVDDETTLRNSASKVVEGGGGETAKMQFVVSLPVVATQDVTLHYKTANSTAKNAATEGVDYVAIADDVLTIPAGQISGVIEVDVLGDAIKEGDEVFNLVMFDVAGAGFSKGTSLTAVGTIVDDEAALQISTGKVVEGGDGETSKMQFLVSLPTVATQDVTVHYKTASGTAKNAATEGTDYVAVADGVLTIAAGTASAIIEVDVLGDAVKEGDEVFNVVLSDPLGAGFAKGNSVTAVGTIVDDEAILSVAAAKLVEGVKGGLAPMQFVVSLSDVAAQDVTFKASTLDSTAKNAAKAGEDYVALSNLDVTIEKGKSSAIIEVEVLNDAVRESDEIFNLKISDVLGAGLTKGSELIAVGTIIDNEPIVTASPAMVIEGGEGGNAVMRFLVYLSDVADQAVEVKYATAAAKSKNAATPDTDYVTTTGTLVIPAGEFSGMVEVPIVGDNIKESNEVFNLLLSDPVGAGFAKGTTLQVVGTIVDDEFLVALG